MHPLGDLLFSADSNTRRRVVVDSSVPADQGGGGEGSSRGSSEDEPMRGLASVSNERSSTRRFWRKRAAVQEL